MQYNIIQHLNIFVWNAFIFFIVHGECIAQDQQVGKYGIFPVSSIVAYKESIRLDSLKKMTDLQSAIPDIVLDLRYAGSLNFMHQNMYPRNTTHSFLRKAAADALSKVQAELNRQGLGLKIFDAYRPYSVTVKFWELVHDDRYVADPSKGSGHNRGIAVDLTIIDLKTKQELSMPTGFDNFTDSAHHDFMNLPEEVLQHRKLLKETMERNGFVSFSTEWWHYSLPDAKRYEVMDLSFAELLGE
jgi:D-alanyl-D-alanine dipeptidase